MKETLKIKWDKFLDTLDFALEWLVASFWWAEERITRIPEYEINTDRIKRVFAPFLRAVDEALRIIGT
jgi:hypothetical protein